MREGHRHLLVALGVVGAFVALNLLTGTHPTHTATPQAHPIAVPPAVRLLGRTPSAGWGPVTMIPVVSHPLILTSTSIRTTLYTYACASAGCTTSPPGAADNPLVQFLRHPGLSDGLALLGRLVAAPTPTPNVQPTLTALLHKFEATQTAITVPKGAPMVFTVPVGTPLPIPTPLPRPPTSYLRPQDIVRIHALIGRGVHRDRPTRLYTVVTRVEIQRTVLAFNGLPRDTGGVRGCMMDDGVWPILTFVKRDGASVTAQLDPACNTVWAYGVRFPTLKLDGTGAYYDAIAAIVGTRDW